ncbi:MAG: hypothetical protein FJX74_24375, partial [Armatimonadetes bacterium]|nr:hypothetical protein [Armatimonadota bacterium]
MAGIEDSPQRIEAGLHLSRAHQHLAKHKPDRALEEAQLAIDADPQFEEPREFMASLHEQLGQPRKAVQQYEHLLHLRGGHDEALLAQIERLDPATAARHRRVASIGADPFVAKGRAVEEDFDGFDEMDSVDAAAPAAGPALRVGQADDDAFVDMEEGDADQAQATVATHHAAADVFADEEGEAAGPRAVTPEEYEYEDERKYRLN